MEHDPGYMTMVRLWRITLSLHQSKFGRLRWQRQNLGMTLEIDWRELMLTECPTKQISLIDTRYPFKKKERKMTVAFLSVSILSCCSLKMKIVSDRIIWNIVSTFNLTSRSTLSVSIISGSDLKKYIYNDHFWLNDVDIVSTSKPKSHLSLNVLMFSHWNFLFPFFSFWNNRHFSVQMLKSIKDAWTSVNGW